MYIFVDETGDHDLVTIDDEYPVFGLGALIVEEDEYTKLDAALHAFKARHFENPETFILHASELKRPLHKKSDPRNKVMLDAEFRTKFYKDLDDSILTPFSFTLAFCYIRKKRMVDAYNYPADPYHFSFENILNRVLRHGGQSNEIFAEKRGEELNTELLAEYERLKKVGIHFFNAESVVSRSNLSLVDKKENISGLQVIDLILSSVTRKYQGKEAKMVGNDCDPNICVSKLACPVTFFPYKR